MLYKTVVKPLQLKLATLEIEAIPRYLRYITVVHCDERQEHSKSLAWVGRGNGARSRPVIWKTLPGRHPHEATFEDIFDHFSNVGFDQQLTIIDHELEHATG